MTVYDACPGPRTGGGKVATAGQIYYNDRYKNLWHSLTKCSGILLTFALAFALASSLASEEQGVFYVY